MKKPVKIFAIISIAFVMLTIGSCLLISEKIPNGQAGATAEELTDKMFEALNKEAWDTTNIVQWSFMGMHEYIWNKENNRLLVRWKDNEVIMDLEKYDGIVKKKGIVISGNKKERYINKAYKFFCNDSFWLIAPFKARDEGTVRSLVTMEDGSNALLVQYTSGGVTPGDSYLWILDNNGLPQAWKMWVKVLPIKGVKTAWSGWTSLNTGAKVATKRGNKFFEMDFSNIKSAQSFKDMNIPDPFEELKNIPDLSNLVQ